MARKTKDPLIQAQLASEAAVAGFRKAKTDLEAANASLAEIRTAALRQMDALAERIDDMDEAADYNSGVIARLAELVG